MHIYVIASLYKASPAKWLGIIRELQGGKEISLAQYAPLRRAIVAEMERFGTGKSILVQGLSLRKRSPVQETIAVKSKIAFNNFLELKPQLGVLKQSYLSRSYNPSPVPWKGGTIEGRFHFSVMSPKNGEKQVYLYASDWPDEKRDAFIELLTIIASIRHSTTREQILFVDLLQSKIIPPKRNYKKMRGDLKQTMELLFEMEKMFAVRHEDES